MKKRPPLKGLPLYYPDSIGIKYWRSLEPIFNAMHTETERQILKLFESPLATDAGLATLDADGIAQTAHEQTQRLRNKFLRIFDRDITGIVLKMLTGVDKHSQTSVAASLGKMYEGGIKADLSGTTAINTGALTISPDFLKTGAMAEQFEAMTISNVALFKTIAEEHFTKVEAAVMGSITDGQGLKDLVPFFAGHSNGTKNYGKLRALDQSRKAYTSINMARMKRLGIKSCQWLHSHGSNAPRKLHQELDGKTFPIDSPPFIGVMYGIDIYDWGGVLPNCRCTAIPVYEFDDD